MPILLARKLCSEYTGLPGPGESSTAAGSATPDSDRNISKISVGASAIEWIEVSWNDCGITRASARRFWIM